MRQDLTVLHIGSPNVLFVCEFQKLRHPLWCVLISGWHLQVLPAIVQPSPITFLFPSSDWLSRDRWWHPTASPLHVRLRTESGAPWQAVAVPSLLCRAIRNDCFQGGCGWVAESLPCVICCTLRLLIWSVTNFSGLNSPGFDGYTFWRLSSFVCINSIYLRKTLLEGTIF